MKPLLVLDPAKLTERESSRLLLEGFDIQAPTHVGRNHNECPFCGLVTLYQGERAHAVGCELVRLDEARYAR